MELMLDNGERKMGEIGGTGREEDARRNAAMDNWSFAIRLGLAIAAIAAAWLLMANQWPAELAGRIFGEVPPAKLPSQLGNLLASIR